MDEFNDESGIDTAENSNITYDSSSDFYSGGSGFMPSTPPTQNIFSFTATGPHTYTVESGVTRVYVLVVGGGGGGVHRSRARQRHRSATRNMGYFRRPEKSHTNLLRGF